MPTSANDLIFLAFIYGFSYGAGVLISKLWSWLRYPIIFVTLISSYQHFKIEVINLPVFIVVIIPAFLFIYPSLLIILNNRNNPISRIIGFFISCFEFINNLRYRYKRYQLTKAQRKLEAEEEKRRRDEEEKQRKAEEKELQHIKQCLLFIFDNCQTSKQFKEMLQSVQIKFTRNPVSFVYLPTMNEYDLITLDIQNEFNIFINNLGSKNKKSDNGQSQQEQTKSPYEILGVSEDMSLADIKRVYTELAKIYHPDTGKVKNDTKFKEINEAFEQIRKMKK